MAKRTLATITFDAEDDERSISIRVTPSVKISGPQMLPLMIFLTQQMGCSIYELGKKLGMTDTQIEEQMEKETPDNLTT